MELLLSLISSVGYWLQVILSFSLLVVAHEFGHFIVAKWTGCRVDEFAVGFGPAIWQHKPKNSETLYALRWIPLGGYNRIWGYEDVSSPDFFEGIPPEEQRRAFVNRPIWARALVLAAGSTFNFALAVLMVALWGMAIGLPYTEIAEVAPDSPAAKAGIAPGDAIRNVGFFSKPGNISALVMRAYPKADAIPQPVTLEVTSPGQRPRLVEVLPAWNEEIQRPMIGITMQEALTTRLGVVWPKSPYAAAGLQKGDEILKVNGEPVGSGLDLIRALDELPASADKVIVEFRRGRHVETTTIQKFRIWSYGVELFPTIATTEMKIAGVGRGSAADIAGLKAGDLITHINGKPVNRKSANWEDLVRAPEAQSVALTVISDQPRVPGQKPVTRELLITASMVEQMVDPISLDQRFMPVGVGTAIREGGIQTVEYTMLIVDSLGSLFRREAAVEDLSGPIGIFSTSYQMAKNGAFDLLNLMLLLTINLGIFNLLPFPALDGGRLIFLGLEAIFRRPVIDIRVENLIHVGGFLILIGFMLFVSFFDIKRLFLA